MQTLILAVVARSLQQSHASLKYMAWDGCSQAPGNFHNGTTRGAALDSELDVAAVRCCKDAPGGLTCETDVNNLCNAGKTWSEAKQICESNGHRLCTLTELQSNVCCGTGCNYDYMTNIWTSTKFEKMVQVAPCPGVGGNTNDMNYTSDGLTGLGIALCYNPSSSGIKWKECSPQPMMFGQAEKCCSDLPLEGGQKWVIPALSNLDSSKPQCAPGVLTDNSRTMWVNNWYKYGPWVAADGCKIRNYGSNSVSSGGMDYYYNTFEKHAVRCCSYDGGTCTTATRLGCESAVTWEEALEACHEMQMRLCTLTEMESYKCCVSGCMFDVDKVWTGTLHPVYRAIQKNQTGDSCNYKEDISSSSTTQYGVVCCGSQSRCVDPTPGQCSMATPGNAQNMCYDIGLELCRDSRLCSRCKQTACYQAGTKIVGTKTYVS